MKVEQIGKALNHYCAALGAQREDTSEYARLAEMLKRRAHIPLAQESG